MIWYLLIMVYCELLHKSSLSLLEIEEWFIGVHLAMIIYLLTNVYIKREVKIMTIFTFDNKIFKYFWHFQENRFL